VRVLFLSIVMGLALGLGAGGEALAQTRRALVVGVNDYQNVTRLAKAVGDAQALKVSLEKLGFTVDLLVNPDRRAFNLGVSAFTAKLKAGDVALFHFSGHGVSLDGENFLLPTDVPKPGSADKEVLKAESFGLSTLVERIRASNARTTILILDACRDNPYATAGTRSAGGRGGLVSVQPPKGPGGIFILYSAGYGQTAADRLADNDPEPTSVYTRTLLRKIAVEGKAITELAREVREDVEALASTIRHEQRPAYYDELSGPPFYFAPPRVQAASPDRAREVELAFWNSIKDSRTAALYSEYLEKFGERATFASIARTRLDELRAVGAQPLQPATPLPALPEAVVSFKPSFDCTTSLGPAEQAICGNAALAARDRIMSELYYRQMDALADDQRLALRGDQRGWLARRRDCERGLPERLTACLAQVYDVRIAELQRGGAAQPPSDLVRSALSVTPSFDCAANLAPAEQAICGNTALANRDRTLTALYGQITQALAGPARQAVVEAQRAWLRKRNTCREPGMAACIAGLYDQRIAELKSMLGQR
jgi:uncharacterized protein